MEKSVLGATITELGRTVEEHLSNIRPEDLVVIEGSGNGLEKIGGEETVRKERIVTMIKT